MCGITGLVAFSPIGEIKLNKLEDSVKALQKRGPDGNGVFKEKTYFGMRGEQDAKDLENAFLRTQTLYQEAFNETLGANAGENCWHDCESRCWHACSGDKD